MATNTDIVLLVRKLISHKCKLCVAMVQLIMYYAARLQDLGSNPRFVCSCDCFYS